MAAVIFDLDDTLYPHVQFVHSGFGAVARYLSEALVRLKAETEMVRLKPDTTGGRFEYTVGDIYARLRRARETGHRGVEFQRLCERYGLGLELVSEMLRVYRTHAPQIWLSHGVVLTMGRLRAEGWRIAILTNGLPAVQAAKVRALGLEAHVDHVFYAAEYADGGKPAKEPFLHALHVLQAPAEDTVMVGDDPVNDVDGARAAGIRTIFLPRAERASHDGADAVVRLLTDVPRVAADLVGHRSAHAA